MKPDPGLGPACRLSLFPKEKNTVTKKANQQGFDIARSHHLGESKQKQNPKPIQKLQTAKTLSLLKVFIYTVFFHPVYRANWAIALKIPCAAITVIPPPTT